MIDKIKLAALVFLGASAGALGAWILMNWLPNVAILGIAVAGGYIVYKHLS